MIEAHIKDPFNHQIVLTEEATEFYTIETYESFETVEQLKRTCHKFIIGGLQDYKIAEIYLMSNYDGEYYAEIENKYYKMLELENRDSVMKKESEINSTKKEHHKYIPPANHPWRKNMMLK